MPLDIIQRDIPKTSLKPGMVVYLAYATKNYTILVVNPNKTNLKTGSEQLHGYTLGGGMNESQFINIMTNLNAGLVVDSVNKEIKTETISDTEAYEARYVLSSDSRPYRTFNIEQVNSIKELSFQLPSAIDSLIGGQLIITNKSSKRNLLTCAQNDDIECVKNIPEVREVLQKTKPRTQQQVQREEAAERENIQQVKQLPIQQVIRDSN